MAVVAMAEIYHQKPSSFIGKLDDYTAYCFDEACAYILTQLRQDKKPIFKGKPVVKRYDNPLDMYRDMGVNI